MQRIEDRLRRALAPCLGEQAVPVSREDRYAKEA